MCALKWSTEDLERGRTGSVLVYSVVLMVALFGLVSLAVDLGHLYTVRSQLQTAADAAAMAGAGTLYGDSRTTADTVGAVAAAAQLAALNTADAMAVSLQPQDVEVGNWDKNASPPFDVARTPTNAVRVLTRRQKSRGNAVQLWFAKCFGLGSCDASAQAIAKVRPPTSAQKIVGVERIRFASLGVLAAVYGDLASNGDIDVGMPLGLLVKVDGDARSYGGSVRRGVLAQITGSTSPLPEKLNYPAVQKPAANDNSQIAAKLNSYGDFTTLLGARIPAGNYVVRDLNMLAGIAIDVEGPVTFYVERNVNIAAGVNLLGQVNTDASKFRVRVLEGGSVNFLANLLTPIYMDLYAPDSDINIAVGVNKFQGRIVGKTLDVCLPVLGCIVPEYGLPDPLDGTRVSLVK